MAMSMVGMTHATLGCIALGTGGLVLGMEKGTATHRLVGRLYSVAILFINGTALSIYDMTGKANVFHLIALVNLTTLALGLAALRRWRRSRDPADLRMHSCRMAMNYVGLWMAFLTELLVNPMLGVSRLGDPRAHWPLMIALNVGLFVGGLLIVRSRTFRVGDPA